MKSKTGRASFPAESTELIPNVLMMVMHHYGVTTNLRIGCGFNIVPMWHPLRLAEDYSMTDILTGGRVIFGSAAATRLRGTGQDLGAGRAHLCCIAEVCLVPAPTVEFRPQTTRAVASERDRAR